MSDRATPKPANHRAAQRTERLQSLSVLGAAKTATVTDSHTEGTLEYEHCLYTASRLFAKTR